MNKFSANLAFLFTEVSFLDRFKKAAKAGFKAVEYMFPYSWETRELTDLLSQYDLEQALFNLPAGNWENGERGVANIPDRCNEFRDGVYLAIEYAKALKCAQVNCLVGKEPTKTPIKAHQTLVDNLHFAATALEREGIRLLIEPLNYLDVPGFYLYGTPKALQLITEIGHPNLWLQYDIYHMQIVEGNLMRTIQANFKRIAHIQIADNPGRNEPGTGEINYPNIFRFLDKLGYEGWIGCEYKPLGRTEDGLAWMKPYRQKE
jgi:hydroxypyruvate isomerase